VRGIIGSMVNSQLWSRKTLISFIDSRLQVQDFAAIVFPGNSGIKFPWYGSPRPFMQS